VDKRFTLALKYYAAGLSREAWALVDNIVQEPSPPIDALNLGVALCLETGAYPEAVDLARRVLERKPDNAPALLAKAQAQFRLGLSAEAEETYRLALGTQQPHPAGWNNLGNILDELGRPADARTAFQRAIAEAPKFSEAHNNLGVTLAGQGEYVAAVVAYRAALECAPDNLAARNNLGVALLEQGQAVEAIREFSGVLAVDPHYRDAADNALYAALYTEEDARLIRDAHMRWGHCLPPATPFHPKARTSDKLRIGYVSPDFRQHSVSYFIEALLAAHDPKAVEIFCYSDVTCPDGVTARLSSTAHTWRDIHGQSDADVLALIRADQIDVLVDLAGHTKGNRLGVFAARGARVQLTAIGYPATTGVPAMDYRLCDAVTQPHEADELFSERPMRLASGMHCYRPQSSAPTIGPLPARASGQITFGSFNKLAKISPATIALWSGALNAVPGSRLVLKTKPLAEAVTRARLLAQFASYGIAAQQIDLRAWVPGDIGHLDLYNTVDIALDTFPYNGTTTTCEALWMGVPVLTLMGEGHAARVGASLLKQVELDEWIAATQGQFIEQAARLSADVAHLEALRRGLRARVAASPLCDARTYARDVEAAYRATVIGSSAG